ncbi:MAG: DUF3450 domain-containing protein [Fibrobacter sp.]|nr:DUF3450 domain-containing protein [Fibrobacter sp.]
MKFKGLNDNKVTKECGLSVGALGQARKGKCDLGKKTIEKILIKYQDLSRVWLLTGEGDMLVPQAQIVNSNVKGSTINAKNYNVGSGSITEGQDPSLLARIAVLENENEHLRSLVESLEADKKSLNERIDKLMDKL